MPIIQRIALDTEQEVILTRDETAEFVAQLHPFDRQFFAGIMQLRGVLYRDGKPDSYAHGWAMGRDWYRHS